ncbi:MAG TPA: PD-(D/E)XK nuclease family protein [Kofleriaceae bacterium]|nr:PD-(D/E)XK nuclease family protein [Kofleriaceae bacterium]
MHDRLLVAATALACAALLLAALRLRRWTRGRRARRRARWAVSGERTAERLLVRAGFRVVDRQVGHRWSIEVDGDTVTAGVRCDYLAERGRERWVAEIKTGSDAPRLDNPATRRQLLEYQVAYGAAGVALVDADAGTVREVRFDLDGAVADLVAERAPAAASPWRWLVAGAAIGAALTAALLSA